VYAGSWDGYLYAVGQDGVEKWRFQTGGGIDSSPVIDGNGILYFTSSDSWLYGIDTGTGSAPNDSPWPFFLGNIRRTGVSPSAVQETPAIDITAVAGGGEPLAFALDIPRPNPFNAVSVIGFSVPRECRVTLDVYSCTGQKVATLAGGSFGAGSHTVVWDASGMPSGVYIVRMCAGHYTATVKAALVK
jgi:hypothetical protein